MSAKFKPNTIIHSSDQNRSTQQKKNIKAEKEHIEKLITDYLSVCKEDGGINKVSLQQLAKAIGVENSEQITQTTELVRVIQNASQQRSCFQSDYSKRCQDKDCIWSTECQKLIAEWMR